MKKKTTVTTQKNSNGTSTQTQSHTFTSTDGKILKVTFTEVVENGVITFRGVSLDPEGLSLSMNHSQGEMCSVNIKLNPSKY